MKDLEKLNARPFSRFCMSIGAVPSSYLASLTIEGQLLWLCQFLEKQVVPTVNNNSEVVKELKEYVEHYFDNLDVQEEINKKLDEMAESGELEEIIEAYLEINGVNGFDTVSDMINSDHITNGTFAKTFGDTEFNDGLGAFYKIRTKLETDVVDGINIIQVISDNTLVAELIHDAVIAGISQEIEDINSDISDINNSILSIEGDVSEAQGNITTLQDDVENIEAKISSPNQFDVPTIMIGDSYAVGESSGQTLVRMVR